MLGVGTPSPGFPLSTPSPYGMRMGMSLGMRMTKAMMMFSAGSGFEVVGGAGGEPVDLLGEGMLDTPSPLVRRARPAAGTSKRQRVMAAGGTPPGPGPESAGAHAEYPRAAKRGNFQGPLVAPLDLSGINPPTYPSSQNFGRAAPPSPVPREREDASDSPVTDDRSGYATTARTEAYGSSTGVTPVRPSAARALTQSPGLLSRPVPGVAPAPAGEPATKVHTCESAPAWSSPPSGSWRRT